MKKAPATSSPGPWCPVLDSYQHDLTITTPSRWRVYQFHQLGNYSPLSQNWCPEQDSNLHTSRRCHLKAVRLPISPSGLYKERGANIQKIADFLNGTARFHSPPVIATITKSTWHRHNTRNDILLSSPLDKPPS